MAPPQSVNQFSKSRRNLNLAEYHVSLFACLMHFPGVALWIFTPGASYIHLCLSVFSSAIYLVDMLIQHYYDPR